MLRLVEIIACFSLVYEQNCRRRPKEKNKKNYRHNYFAQNAMHKLASLSGKLIIEQIMKTNSESFDEKIV